MAVTLKDVAGAVGVSRQVVATVLTGQGSARASAETRDRIIRVASEMGYRPHAAARSLATGKTRNIELQSHAIGDSIYHLPLHHLPLWAGVAQALQEHAYNLILVSRHDEEGQVLTRNLCQHNVDGLVLLGVFDFDVLELAYNEGVPAIVVNPEMSVTELTAAGHSVINFDNAGGIHSAVDYLVGLGHHDIGFARGLSKNSDFAERWQAFQDAMAAHRLPVREEWVWQALPWVQGGETIGQQIITRTQRPTAILTANDNLALGIMRSLAANNVKVPDDISLMGFDDIEAASIVYPGLTTVRLDWGGMGRLAADRLVAILNEESEADTRFGELRYPLHLVRRQSCRAHIPA